MTSTLSAPNAQAENLIRYWRACLADTALGKGRFKHNERKKLAQLNPSVLECGVLGADLTKEIFKKQDAKIQEVEVCIWPIVLALKKNHGLAALDRMPAFVAPVVSAANINREGQIRPTKAVIARDLLTPLADGSFAIGEIEKLDVFLTTWPLNLPPEESAHREIWEAYKSHCERMIKQVTGDWPKSTTDYLQAGYGLLEVVASGTANQNIIKLYDALLEKTPTTPLLQTYATEKSRDLLPSHSAAATLAVRRGYCNDVHPLADHQRDALAHLSQIESGDVIAVNGPPGSGKTTMLLSAVAGLWVDAALLGGDPPIIIAASANNQAVTNIIDAFGKDFGIGKGPFAGRWLPGIKSFGSFLASKTSQDQAPNAYQYESFFETIENEEYFNNAQVAFLEKAALAFPELAEITIENAVDALQSGIKTKSDLLTSIQLSLDALKDTQASVGQILGQDPQARLQKLTADAGSCKELHAANTETKRAWDVYRADESMWMSLLSFLPPVRKKRTLKARVFLESRGLTDVPDGVDAMTQFIGQKLSDSDAAAALSHAQLELAQKTLDDHRKAKDGWAQIAQDLGITTSLNPHEVDMKLDTTLRFEMFLLATHYWEGRWLLAMQDSLPIPDENRWKTTEKVIVPRWQRRMMVTPCSVATFASLPRKLGCYRPDDPKSYLYNFIDLLIVDEAGQVLPEVAAASFSLAKTALVIGDTKQLEPIVGVPPVVDVGNLIESGVLASDHGQANLDALDDLGVRTTSGSVMKRAQVVCRYHPYPDLERGLHLFEHRRCYDEIIKYSNDLCYEGTLKPMRGQAPADDVIQPLGYLHIDGFCRKAGGSNFNELEAQTIAAWLKAHREILEKKYNGTLLEDIVGIVTPFGRQAAELERACQAEKLNTEKMTIGTVHKLQGADRPIVIFSPTYSKHADGGFVDRSKSMLNVAVSRAKDSFMVFGDMDLFSNALPGSPRYILAQTLMQNGSNALTFEMAQRTDLSDADHPVTVLRDAQDHDAFLVKLLHNTTTSVCIVSPWITVANARGAGILDAAQAARKAGAEIEVMTDPALTSPSDLNEMHAFCKGTDITFTLVRQLHSKIVIEGDGLLSIGSYNWLSASRTGQFARHETSFVYRGEHLNDEIELTVQSLRRRVVPQG